MDLCQSPRGECDHQFHKFSINSIFFRSTFDHLGFHMGVIHTFFLNYIASHYNKKPYEPNVVFDGSQTAPIVLFGLCSAPPRKSKRPNIWGLEASKLPKCQFKGDGTLKFQTFSRGDVPEKAWPNIGMYTLFGGLRFQISFCFLFPPRSWRLFVGCDFFWKKSRLRKFWDALQWTSVAS